MLRMISIVFILALFSFSNLYSQQVEEIEWIPVEPVEGDDVIVAVHGMFRDATWSNRDIQGRSEGNNLTLTFASVSEGWGGQIMNPFTVSHNWGALDAGEYTLRVQQTVGFINDNGMLDIRDVLVYESEITVTGEDPDEFVIALEEGWNMSSSPIAPEDDDIRVVFSELVDGGSLIIAKNGQGQFYVTEQNFNNIPEWDAHQGYLIKVIEDDELLISGEILPEDDNIELTAGWSMIAYLPEAEISAPVAFENITDNLILAKDGVGQFYSPEHNFSNIGDLSQGNGYLVKLEEADDLIWNQR